MDEASRIRALREQGRIDDAQAERLLAALGVPPTHTDPEGDPSTAAPVGDDPRSSDATATDVYGSPSVASDTAAPGRRAAPGIADDGAGDGPVAGTPVERAAPSGRDAPGSAGVTAASATSARRWARIELFAGALDVSVDDGLDAPRAESEEGPLEVSRDGEGWRIAQPSRKGDSWIERLVDGTKRMRVRIALPAGVGVHLDVKAGDVNLRDVPALRGRLLAGDLDARGLRAVDVALNAGDLDLRFDPEPGEHRVQMTAGDAEIRLPKHAGVTVRGRVSVGDASAPAPFETKRSGVSERVSGTLGDGRASLSVELVTGDLDLKVD